MSEKIKGFMTRHQLDMLKEKLDYNAIISNSNDGDYCIEVQVEVIPQPVYEYQVLFQVAKNDIFRVTDFFYLNINDFLEKCPEIERKNYNFYKIIEETKRIRK